MPLSFAILYIFSYPILSLYSFLYRDILYLIYFSMYIVLFLSSLYSLLLYSYIYYSYILYYNCIISLFLFCLPPKGKDDFLYYIVTTVIYSILYSLFSFLFFLLLDWVVIYFLYILYFFSFVYCRANCNIFLYRYICYSYLYTIIVIL